MESPATPPMGVIADSLRASLRELAAADVRLYRGLAAELATTAPTPDRALPPATDDATDEAVTDVVAAFKAVRDSMTEAQFLRVFEETPQMSALWDALMQLEDATA